MQIKLSVLMPRKWGGAQGGEISLGGGTAPLPPPPLKLPLFRGQCHNT